MLLTQPCVAGRKSGGTPHGVDEAGHKLWSHLEGNNNHH
jgi:hypothetical protein